MEAGTRIETVENGKGNDRSVVTPVSPQLEQSTSLFLDTENQNLEIGISADITKDGITSNTNDQKEGIENGMPSNTVEDRSQSDMIELNNFQKTFLEPMRTDDDHSGRSNDFMEASACEVIELKSIESVARIIKEDFVLSSGAALLPHLSEVLTGGEDAYFINGQTWLGVADIDNNGIITSE
ncbi:Hypothetical predicted protein [Olea europaea subsp. europaea]|uniref:Uncharacterized protein n=1 Tax=Olea europaea subsp. europaea TaxID=158383 RepID=A0A8S0QRC2_OLEEU|nr:Hypothetical predicted protein [Olea europaea subsp. europaea]